MCEEHGIVHGTTEAGGPPVVEATSAHLVERARTLVASGERRILGITGPPGAGKSTLCDALRVIYAAVDERNASLVEPTRGQADLIAHWITAP